MHSLLLLDASPNNFGHRERKNGGGERSPFHPPASSVANNLAQALRSYTGSGVDNLYRFNIRRLCTAD